MSRITNLHSALGRLNFVMDSYVVSCSSLDIFMLFLKEKPLQKALSETLTPGRDLAYNYVALSDGEGKHLHEPISSEVILTDPSHYYAHAYFSSLRDVAMCVKKYLRDQITSHYIPSSSHDESWFHSWREFLVYTNIDIETIPEAPAIAMLFEIDDILSLRNVNESDRFKFGAARFFEFLAAAKDFVKAVDVMVEHDLTSRRKSDNDKKRW